MPPTTAEKAMYSEGLKTVDVTQKGGRINVLSPLIVFIKLFGIFGTFDCRKSFVRRVDNRNYFFFTNLPFSRGFVSQSYEIIFSYFLVLTIIPATPLMQIKRNHGFDRGSKWWTIQDSNLWLPPRQGDTLPAELIVHSSFSLAHCWAFVNNIEQKSSKKILRCVSQGCKRHLFAIKR